MNSKKKAIIDILKDALKRETDAYNFYIKARQKAVYPETESLFIQLAEEERNHRTFIQKEIDKLEKLLVDDQKDDKSDSEEIRYPIPEFPEFRRVDQVPFIDMIFVSLPSELISGDHLKNFILKRNGTNPALGIFLYDVMGHGLKANKLNAVTKQFINKLYEKWNFEKSDVDFRKPHETITALNRGITAACQSECRFITSFYGVLEPEKSLLTYTSAGHEPPVIIKQNGEYFHLEITELLIGADKDVVYSEVKVPVASGDIIILFSDGLTEVRNEKDEMFERQNLVRTVQEVCTKSSTEIVNKIFTSLRQYAAGGSLTDDISLAVLKVLKRH